MLREHLGKLCQNFSLVGLQETSRGTFQLPFEQFILTFRELEIGLVISSPITHCPKNKLEEFFSYLMSANFIGQGTGGSAIGLDPEEKFLTLSQALPYDMDYKAFQEILEDFVNYLDYWKEEIKRHEEEAEKFL